MDLAMGAVGSLAPKLAELLKDEYIKHKGLKPAVESISRELLMMEPALRDVSQMPSDQLNEVDKHWAQQVRELSYDMEDAVDSFMVRVAGRDPAAAATDANVFKKIAGKAAAMMNRFKDRHQIADRIEHMKNLSKELHELHVRYTNSGTAPNVNPRIDPRVLSLYKNETELVGIGKATEQLIRMLTEKGGDESSYLSLKRVSIVGSGGLGKTALARVVHDRLKETKFDCWAFISVGRKPNITVIFATMLRRLDDEKYSNVDMSHWHLDQFVDELHKFLHKKRYFIVVDDIWDEESWESISYALMDNKCGSRIIITSRNHGIVSKVSNVYKLQPLSRGKSKELFYKRIFSGEQECLDNQPADEVLEKIIDKCDGVPLAIIAIASLLAGRPWEDWCKVYDSIVFGHEDNTMTILSYSYYDLPSYLKPCLLILGLCPEDYGFAKHSIIWLWMAEGFIKENGRQRPFEIGERYFNELLNRCMIQPQKSNTDRSISFYGVHDIVLDLIRELSMEENFVTLLHNNRQHSSLDSARRINYGISPGCDRKARRLAIQNFHAAHITKDIVVITDGVRSLVVSDNLTEMMPPICSFQACRVLDIVNCQNLNIKNLGKLRQLRFLVLNYTPVVELPKEIRELKFLQTLVLKYIGLEELTAAVCDLTQLMFMEAIGFKRVPADRMGNLVSLEELSLEPLVGRSETVVFVIQLGKLTRLRVLKIRFVEELNESSQEALVKSLCSLEEIKDLQLNAGYNKWKSTAVTAWEGWEPPRQLWRLYIGCFSFSRMPAWINPSRLGCICYLSLSVDAVEPNDIDNLGRLQELLYLELCGRRIHQGCTIGAERFKNLSVCRVDTVFKFLQGAMPNLESLSLKVIVKHIVNGVQYEDFRTRDAIPDLDLGLGNLLSLEEIIVSVDCSASLAADVEEAVSLVTCAVKHHPKHPTIIIKRSNEDSIVSDEDSILSDQDLEGDHDDSVDTNIQSVVNDATEQDIRSGTQLQLTSLHLDQ